MLFAKVFYKKITRIVKRRIEEVTNEELRLFLQEIIRKAHVGLSFSSIHKIVFTSGFCLKVLQLKFYWMLEQKETYREFIHKYSK